MSKYLLNEALICWAFLLANFTPVLQRMEGQALGRPKRFKGIGWMEKVCARKKKREFCLSTSLDYNLKVPECSHALEA